MTTENSRPEGARIASARKPNDVALERDVIALCLLRPELIQEMALGEEDFAMDAHRMVWAAMCAISDDGEPVNHVSVRSRLIDRDELEAVGGEGMLAAFRGALPARTLPVARLRRMTKLRALKATALQLAEAAESCDMDAASAVLEAAGSMSEDTTGNVPQSLLELAEDWWAAAQAADQNQTISPGIEPIKRIIGRLDPGSVTLVGADTSCCKSTLSMEMGLGAVLDGERFGYCSAEDPPRIVTERVMSAIGNIPAPVIREFRPGDGNDAQIAHVLEVMRHVNDRVLVSNCIGMNEREVLEQMTVMAKRGVRLCVVDYIGVISSSIRQQDRRNEIRWIFTRLKARALRLNMALVVVSQFQRPKEGDSGRKPTKHSFRESGDLEAMAEYAIVGWRKAEDDYAPIYWEMAKSKTGGTGKGWTMQREYQTRDGKMGSGRLVEVAHGDDYVTDRKGQRVYDLREVLPDPSGMDRWNPYQTARHG